MVGSVIYMVGWDSINLRHLLGFSALWLFELLGALLMNSSGGLAVGTNVELWSRRISATGCEEMANLGNASLGLLDGYKARPVGYKQRRSPRHVER